MAEEIGFENGRNSNFQGLVTLTLDPAIRHTVGHHSSTSTYIPNFIEIEETFCGRTDIFPPILLGRLLEVDLKTKFWVFQVSNNDFQGHFKCNIQMCNSFAALLAIYLIIQMLAVANELTVPVKCA